MPAKFNIEEKKSWFMRVGFLLVFTIIMGVLAVSFWNKKKGTTHSLSLLEKRRMLQLEQKGMGAEAQRQRQRQKQRSLAALPSSGLMVTGVRLDKTEDHGMGEGGKFFRGHLRLFLMATRPKAEGEGTVECSVQKDGERNTIRQVRFPFKGQWKRGREISLFSENPVMLNYGKSYGLKCDLPGLPGTLLKFQVPANRPLVRISHLMMEQVNQGKYRMGFALENGGWPMELSVEISCQIHFRDISGDVYWGGSFWISPLVFSSSSGSKKITFSEPDEEIEMPPGDFLAKCHLESPQEGRFVDRSMAKDRFHVPHQRPTLELTYATTEELEEGFFTLAVNLRNLGGNLGPVPIAINCGVFEKGKKGLEGNGARTVWKGIQEFSRPLPRGEMTVFAFSGEEGGGMELSAQKRYRATCEILPSAYFAIENKKPFIYEFSVKKGDPRPGPL